MTIALFTKRRSAERVMTRARKLDKRLSVPGPTPKLQKSHPVLGLMIVPALNSAEICAEETVHALAAYVILKARGAF